MLVGFEGTVGGSDSLKAAVVAVAAERLAKSWAVIFESPPPGAFASGDASVTAGGRVTQMLNRVPAIPQMLIPKLLSEPIGQVIDMGIGGARTVDHKIGRIGEEMIAGSISDREYEHEDVVRDMHDLDQHGFIKQLTNSYTSRGASKYFKGPTTLGVQSKQTISDGVEFIVKSRRPGEELIVAGYSRGGLIAINVCDQIAKLGHEIDLLILLDPVDRAADAGHCDVSAAVKNCVLLQRNDNIITWRPFTRQVKFPKLAIPDVRLTGSRARWTSRWWFGRMVTEDDRDTLTKGFLVTKTYEATHAAFGGVPWSGNSKPDWTNERQDRILTMQMAHALNRTIFELSGEWDPGLQLTYRSKP